MDRQGVMRPHSPDIAKANGQALYLSVPLIMTKLSQTCNYSIVAHSCRLFRVELDWNGEFDTEMLGYQFAQSRTPIASGCSFFSLLF